MQDKTSRVTPEDLPAGVKRAASDIKALFPSAELTWDLRLSPYMVTVTVNGIAVRGFIEPLDLARGGEMYERVKNRLVELINDALGDRSSLQDWRQLRFPEQN
jgi:hypothetical protein